MGSFTSVNQQHISSKRREQLTGIHCELNICGNYLFEEILNSVTHGIGCLAALFGTALLMAQAMKEDKVSNCCSICSPSWPDSFIITSITDCCCIFLTLFYQTYYHFYGSVVFCLSLNFLFLASTVSMFGGWVLADGMYCDGMISTIYSLSNYLTCTLLWYFFSLHLCCYCSSTIPSS